MSVASTRILVVGDLLPGTGEILRRLSNKGFGSRHVKTLREAREILDTFDFHIVLATELLQDGRGYDLAEPVSRHSRTLIVGVALTESCLWLPVTYRGVRKPIRRVLRPRPARFPERRSAGGAELRRRAIRCGGR